MTTPDPAEFIPVAAVVYAQQDCIEMIQFPGMVAASVALSSSWFWLLFTWISLDLYLPYLAGAVVLIIGAIGIRKEVSNAHGADRIIIFGPMFLAAPMAVFGTEHFVFSESVTPMVPSWIPGHLFWVLLIGVCLIAGALSLVLRRYEMLAAALFGTMLFLFVLLIHIPTIVHMPNDRFAWAVALRDLAFGAGAVSFAAARGPLQWKRSVRTVFTCARFSIGIAAVFFATEHFLHPEFKPGVPLRQMTPAWVPGHLILAYLTGVFLLLAGLGLIFDKRVRLAATALGLQLLVLVIVVYVPIVIAQPSAIGSGLNYLADSLLLSGSALCFAGSHQARLLTQSGSTQVTSSTTHAARSVAKRRVALR